MSASDEVTHNDMANAIRALAMDAVEQAQSGHPGMPMGMADVATVLFSRYLRFDPAVPDWPDRDRFVLSAGHGSMLLYSLLYLTGYSDMSLDEIKRFRQLGSKTPGHPEYGIASGIETTTGPLGQGLGNAVGMALAEAIMNARFGESVVDHRTYVIASDGDLMEGISHEAASLAGHLGLGKLVVFYDDNSISIDGPTSLAYSDDVAGRFAAYGWHTQAVDGHDPETVAAAIEAAQADGRPSLIACRTTIGFGAPNKAGTAATHGAPLGGDEVSAAREQLGWSHPPFEVPEAILEAWRAVGRQGRQAREGWMQRLAALDSDKRQAFEQALSGTIPRSCDDTVQAFKAKMAEEAPKEATRKVSGKLLEGLIEAVPELIGGAADLTRSNNTKPKNAADITAEDFTGRYVRFGVREHGMAAALNGMALHGGVLPYGGSFLIFTDYCRPSIRLAALMGVRSIFVMTHDSIGLGEDGPTHQPIEQLAALRAMPNLAVFRPADAVEVAECWQLALKRREGPSVIALTRQGVPTLRQASGSDDNACKRGAYVLREAGSTHQVTVFATGSEVALAVEAAETLEGEGTGVRVVSVPSWELFWQQPESYRTWLLARDTVRVAVEAAAETGWHRFVGEDGAILGMTGFGESAPSKEVFKHFGFTGAGVAELVRRQLG